MSTDKWALNETLKSLAMTTDLASVPERGIDDTLSLTVVCSEIYEFVLVDLSYVLFTDSLSPRA